jgi:tRNA A-37 threonylcarbamoyl transferase component Bud32
MTDEARLSPGSDAKNQTDSSPGHSLGDLPTEGAQGLESSVSGIGSDHLGFDETRGSHTIGRGIFVDEDDLTLDLKGDYEVEETELAHGGMGTVHRAIHRRLQRPVAIKFVHPKWTTNPEVRKRFVNEARAMTRLRHNNIVQVYDVGFNKKDGRLFMELELVEGGSLASYLAQKGKLTALEAVELAIQVCDALTLAHKENIIHRDIKPSNILLTRDRVPKLCDFGLARYMLADASLSQSDQVVGTPLYMAPEQRNGKADQRSDIYSLAATLYQMVTGEVPHVIRLERIEPILRNSLTRALEHDPDKRFQSAPDFALALRLVIAAPAKPEGRELAEGQCRSCGYLNNRHRNLCDNCGRKMRERCLECTTENAVWENICDGCGKNISKLIAERREQIAAEKIAIKSMCSRYQYVEAIERLQRLAMLDHPQFTDEVAWAQELLQESLAELRDHEQRRNAALGAARGYYQAFDDHRTVKLLDGIPDPFKDAPVLQLLEQARSREQRVKELQTTIDAALKNTPQWNRDPSRSAEEDRAMKAEQLEHHYIGLRAKLETFLQLRPNASGYIELLNEVKEREDVNRLAKEISYAIARKQYDGLTVKVRQYLKLRPWDENAKQMLSRLEQWEQQRDKRQRQAYELVQQARRDFDGGDYAKALKTLEQLSKDIPEPEEATRLRKAIRSALENALNSGLDDAVRPKPTPEPPLTINTNFKVVAKAGFDALLGAVIGYFAGLILYLFAWMVIGLVTWNSNTGQAAGKVVWWISLLGGTACGAALCASHLLHEAKRRRARGSSVSELPLIGTVAIGGVALLALLMGYMSTASNVSHIKAEFVAPPGFKQPAEIQPPRPKPSPPVPPVEVLQTHNSGTITKFDPSESIIEISMGERGSREYTLDYATRYFEPWGQPISKVIAVECLAVGNEVTIVQDSNKNTAQEVRFTPSVKGTITNVNLRAFGTNEVLSG